MVMKILLPRKARWHFLFFINQKRRVFPEDPELVYDDFIVSSCFYESTFTQEGWLTLSSMNSSVICPGKHAPSLACWGRLGVFLQGCYIY